MAPVYQPDRGREDDDAGEANGDDEPSLGSLEDHPNGYYDGSDHTGRSQERWAHGNPCGSDCEGDEHDGWEPDVDNEPSLCRIHVECNGGAGDYEADFGSPDGIVDQRLTMLSRGIPWSVEDGEEDGPANGVEPDRRGLTRAGKVRAEQRG